MSTLDDQLRSAADAVHQRMEHLSIPEFGDHFQGVGKARRSTAALAVLGAAAAVVIIVVVVVAVASYGQHKPSKVVGPTPSTAALVPHVVGMQQGSAVHVLAAAGLKSTIERVFNDSVPARLVIAEEPLPGSSVTRATTITLVVSNGPAAHVPNVLGMHQAQAVRELAGVGLESSITTNRNASVPAGIVETESPAANSVAASGTVIALVVSSGPPCSATQLTALAPEWASPLTQQTDDLLRFTNHGGTCELFGYPSVVAAAPGQPDVRAKPGWFGIPPSAAIVLPKGSTAQLIVAALHGCMAATQPYTMLTVAMPGGGSVTVTLPNNNVSQNPNQNGRNLTLLLARSCSPPLVGYFSH